MENNQKWTSIIKPRTGLFDLRLQEVWQYRDLIKMFVKKEIITYYKQTVLGGAWFVISPLLTTTVFTVVFGLIAKLPTNGVPNFLFYMLGNTIWTLFATCLQSTSNTFIRNSSVMGKVYFPRLTVPIATIIFSFISFMIQFSVFIILWIVFLCKGAIHPSFSIVFMPVILLQECLLGLGFGLIVTSLTTRFRDLQMVVSFGISLWMYLSPTIYSVTSIPEKYQNIYMLNPMAPILEYFRASFFGEGWISGIHIGISFFSTVVFLMIGILLFNKMEKNFMDTI